MANHDMTSDANHEEEEEEEEVMLDQDEADEVIDNRDEDEHMDSDPDDEEINLQNDSVAHFDTHHDSIFCISQHPIHTNIIATGGGDDKGYVFDSSVRSAPTSTSAPTERSSIPSLIRLDGHTDSLNAITFTYPNGEYLVTAGLDGQLRAYSDSSSGAARSWTFLGAAQEVEEINFLVPCPNPAHPNTIALGASDGSVWIYTVDASEPEAPLTIVQALYLHTESCTAGAWTPDGKLLCTVAEDGSFYAWDAFGDAAAAGLVQPDAQNVVGLTAQDERFRVDGGLFSVAVAPNGSFAAVGGAFGAVRIVGLPRLGADPSAAGTKATKSKGAGGKASAAKSTESSAGQAGQILASLQTQGDSVETIAFAAPPMTLMATGSVDGSICLYDVAHRFATRRHIKEAHEDQAVIKVEFRQGDPNANHVLTSCGNDGAVKRWDARGGTAAAAQGFLDEFRGHRGGGEGGGVLGFVQRDGRHIITAGDE